MTIIANNANRFSYCHKFINENSLSCKAYNCQSSNVDKNKCQQNTVKSFETAIKGCFNME